MLAGKAGFRLPITSYALQAMVSEPIKPVLHTVAASWATGMYVSQSDKGELVFGAGLDLYPSYAQRGNLNITQGVVAGMLEIFPCFRGLKMLRQWAGIVDVPWDYSPILGPAPVGNLFLNCRLGYRRIQGDAGRRLFPRARDGDWRTSPDLAAVRHFPFHHRRTYRRSRRRRHLALTDPTCC